LSITFKTLLSAGFSLTTNLPSVTIHTLKQKEPAMSKMSELVIDIEDMLEQGKSFAQVARDLEIPIHFVVEAAELIEQNQEECSPYATINS
jgi:type II secretory pathway component PulF